MVDEETSSYSLSLPGITEFDNGKYLIQFPSGAYSHVANLSTRTQAIIREDADKSYPVTRLSKKELSTVNADSGYIFNYNIKLHPLRDKYAYCKVVLLYNSRPTLLPVFFFYQKENEGDIAQEIEKCLPMVTLGN